MKPDAVFVYALTTFFVNCWYVAAGAFVSLPEGATSSSSSSSGAAMAAQHRLQGKNAAAGLMAAGAFPATYINDMAAGSVSFQPHDSEEATNVRANVYDPGDELLRALNAEIAASGQELGTMPEEPDYADTVFNELEVANKYEMLRKLENDLREEQEIVSKSALLMKLLEDPSVETLPVVYVEENPAEFYNNVDNNNMIYPSDTGISKRSRYYRRYPWKRHNRNRSSYEPELRYACTPTKEDVFKLLMNLHENRKGNHSKTVNFCNRKRPAKAIFTNIRFLG